MTQTIFKKPLKFKKNHFLSHDVVWFAKNRKTPIAWSTTADSNSITLLNQQYDGLINVITAYNNHQILLNKEELEIIQILISHGIANVTFSKISKLN